MKYPADHKANVKQRLREQAADQIRENGIDNVSIKSVMSAEDMTVGGFYSHFENREHLISEAIAESFDQIRKLFLASLAQSDTREWTARFVDIYLSDEHRNNRSEACPIAGLLSQIPSQSERVREEFKQQTENLIAAYSAKLSGLDESAETTSAARTKTWSLLAILAGGLQLSRAMNDEAHIREVLESCRISAMELLG